MLIHTTQIVNASDATKMEVYLIKTLLKLKLTYQKHTTSKMTNMNQVNRELIRMYQFNKYYYSEYNPDRIMAYKIHRIKNILHYKPEHSIDTLNDYIERDYTCEVQHHDLVLGVIYYWYCSSIFKKILATITQEGIYRQSKVRTLMYKAYIQEMGELHAVNNLQAKNIMKDFKYDNKNALDEHTSDNEQYISMIEEEHNKLFDRYKTKIKKIPTLKKGASVIWCIQTVKLLEELSHIIAVQKHFETLIYLICRLPNNVPEVVMEHGRSGSSDRCEDDLQNIEIYHPMLNIIKESFDINKIIVKIRSLEKEYILCMQSIKEIKSHLSKTYKTFEHIRCIHTKTDYDGQATHRAEGDIIHALRYEMSLPKEDRKSEFTDAQLCNMLCIYYNFNACTYIKNNSK